ncbi:MAG: hypothetical protein ABJA67_10290 [Chthonomonadales bacterium]
MSENPSYISSIPDHAREEDITAKHGAGRGKVVKNYYLGRTYIGQRVYNRDGHLQHEWSFKNGKKHGWQYNFHDNGGMYRALHFDNGIEHGTAQCWGLSGALLGTYTMDHGTGIDFWWNECNGKPQLTEARFVVDNLMEGYEYWWYSWGKTGALRKEKWWSHGRLHGIEREWNYRGGLRRGFPNYWICGEEVDKRKYERAAKKDATLKPFSIEDNKPHRIFPPEVAAKLV